MPTARGRGRRVGRDQRDVRAKPMARKAVKKAAPRTPPPDDDGRVQRTRGAAPVTLTIGVDIGGTKVLGGVVDPDG